MNRRLPRRPMGIVLFGLAAAGPLEGQDAPRVQLEGRAAFLVTFASGHADRPLAALEAGYRIVVPRVGGPPGLTVTVEGLIGFAEFFAEAQSESFRLGGGIELPWVVAARGLGRAPLEIVPNLQAGFLSSNGGDRREGLYGRAGLGLRAPIGGGGMHLTFEPLALVALPQPDLVTIGGAAPESRSRFAIELGIVAIGWRF